MGSRLFLPFGPCRNPYPSPQTEREVLLNRLWATRTLLPDARTMPLEQLRDYVQRQEDRQRLNEYGKRDAPRAPLTPEQVRDAKLMLKELLAWRKRRTQSSSGRTLY